MTIVQLAAYVGKEAKFSHEGMKFPVIIVDVKTAYGKTLFKIKPVGGSGEKWTTSENIGV